MSAITLDPELRSRLNGLNEHLEVHDETGAVVGHFLPNEHYVRLLYSWAREQFADDDEQRRAMSEPGGLSTPEALEFVRRKIREAKGMS